jgi:hypothetical protein
VGCHSDPLKHILYDVLNKFRKKVYPVRLCLGIFRWMLAQVLAVTVGSVLVLLMMPLRLNLPTWTALRRTTR